MTNYIEEMMLTAGIKKDCMYTFYTYENKNIISINTKQHLIDMITRYKCKGKVIRTSGRPKIYLPDFTPEKQLEIIKLIIDIQLIDFGIDMDYKQRIEGKDFVQALAQLTTELMKAGKLDKEKVKEVFQG